MEKQEYRIEMIRISKPRIYASKEVEAFINSQAEEGWNLRSIMFHADILTYEIVFIRQREE